MGFGRRLGKKLRKKTKKLRRAAKKVGKGAWKASTAVSHVVSKKVLKGAFDPWSKEGRQAQFKLAAATAAGFATGGVAGAAIAGGLGIFGGVQEKRFADSLKDAGVDEFDPVNASEDAAAFGGEAPAAESKSNAKVVLVVVGVVGGILVLRRLKKGK